MSLLQMRFLVPIPMKYILCLGVAILVVCLLVFFTARGIMKMNQLKADRDGMKANIGQVREENRKLAEDIAKMHTIEGLEERARELGLVRKDELVYIFNH